MNIPSVMSLSSATKTLKASPSAPTKKVRRAGVRGDDKRERILDAALVLFAERGFHGTAVPLIAEEAGVGAGTLYRYFTSKEHLVNELYRTWKTKVLAYVVEGFPEHEAPRTQWRYLFRKIVAFFATHPAAFKFLELHHHAPYLDEESRALETQAFALATLFLEDTAAREITKNVSPMTIVSLVWGGIVQLLRGADVGLVPVDPSRKGHPDEATLDAFERLAWEAVRL